MANGKNAITQLYDSITRFSFICNAISYKAAIMQPTRCLILITLVILIAADVLAQQQTPPFSKPLIQTPWFISKPAKVLGHLFGKGTFAMYYSLRIFLTLIGKMPKEEG